jgi:hypothetical protein
MRKGRPCGRLSRPKTWLQRKRGTKSGSAQTGDRKALCLQRQQLDDRAGDAGQPFLEVGRHNKKARDINVTRLLKHFWVRVSQNERR